MFEQQVNQSRANPDVLFRPAKVLSESCSHILLTRATRSEAQLLTGRIVFQIKIDSVSGGWEAATIAGVGWDCFLGGVLNKNDLFGVPYRVFEILLLKFDW